MKFYPTPPHIVDVVKRHLPRSVTSVLEPAVGEGALLDIFPDTFDPSNLTLVDISQDRLKSLKKNYRGAKFVPSDFLEWASKRKKPFDLVVTNPPFSGKANDWVEYEGKQVPIEVGFIDLCIKLLSKNGTLIGIVPDSIINSKRWSFLRKKMIDEGSFSYVYQLPEKTFYRIEGAFFLFVYKKGRCSKYVRLRRYNSPGETIDAGMDDLNANELRLDFDFYNSKSMYQNLIHTRKCTSIESVASFKRGGNCSGYKNPGYIHTTDLSFYPKVLGESKGINLDDCAIALKRVSRDANLSFSLIVPNAIDSCTDCLFIGVPSPGEKAVELLFSLRVLFSNSCGSKLLLKGVGAKFITITNLMGLPFKNLAMMYPEIYLLYKQSLLAEDQRTCLHIERVLFDCFRFGEENKNVEYTRLKRSAACLVSASQCTKAKLLNV